MKMKKISLTIMLTMLIMLLFPAASFSVSVEEEQTTQHVHSFSVQSVNPASLSEDGEIRYKCDGCDEEKTESIARIDIDSVKLSEETAQYTGKSISVSVIAKDINGTVLVLEKDYTVSYSNNVNPGKATVDVNFKGNYTGTKTLNFTIVCSHKYGEWSTVKKATTSADGKMTCTCEKCGSVKSSVIKKIASVTLADKSMAYTGKQLKNKVTVKNSDDKTLKNGTDYTLTYKNNIKYGTAQVTVTFKGKYSGTVQETYKITHEHKMSAWKSVTAATVKKSGTKSRNCVCGYTQTKTVDLIKSVTLSKTSVAYTGKNIKVAVTVKNSSGSKLTAGTNYTVSYSANKDVGTAKVTVTFKGFYSGKVTKTFQIVPPSTAFTQTTPGSKEMLVKWKKKTTQVTGYQIQYSTDKAFSSGVKTLTVTDKNKNVAMIYDLTAKKTYYTRIRTYLTKGGKKYYSQWSSLGTAKTKTAGRHYIEGSIPESAAVSSTYFDDVVFIGDSISLGLSYYEAANNKLGKAQFLTAGSLSATNALWSVSSSSVHPRYKGVKMKLEQSVPQTKAKKIYIMLGMNDISMGIDYSLKNFQTLCNNIHKAAPSAVFYVQSVTPKVNQGTKNYSSYLNNRNITTYNKKLSQMCRKNGWFFVNVSETMFDSLGFLKRSYCSDPSGMGMHYTYTGCAAWVEYLYRHTA